MSYKTALPLRAGADPGPDQPSSSRLFRYLQKLKSLWLWLGWSHPGRLGISDFRLHRFDGIRRLMASVAVAKTQGYDEELNRRDNQSLTYYTSTPAVA